MIIQNKKKIEISLNTTTHPDSIGINQFKERVKKQIKMGFIPDGELTKNPNGSYSQKFFKWEDKKF